MPSSASVMSVTMRTMRSMSRGPIMPPDAAGKLCSAPSRTPSSSAMSITALM